MAEEENSANAAPIFQQLGMSSKPPVAGEVTVYEPVPEDPIKDPSLNNDFSYTRESLRTVVEKGLEALEDLKDLAESSQHPEMYASLSSLISSVAGAADKLMKSHVQHKALIAKSPQKSPNGLPGAEAQQITNNLIFTGSTEELAKVLKDLRSKE